MRTHAALLVALASCGSPKLPCETVAAGGSGEIAALIVERCVKDDWSADARECIMKIHDHEACRALLGGDADRFLEQEELAARAIRAEAELVRAKTEIPREEFDAKAVVIEIPVVGDLVVGGKAVAMDQLDSLFEALVKRDAGTKLVLEAAKGVAHGRVVDIMERAKRAGLNRLAIGTSP